jgi:hypothetical protein
LDVPLASEVALPFKAAASELTLFCEFDAVTANPLWVAELLPLAVLSPNPLPLELPLILADAEFTVWPA